MTTCTFDSQISLGFAIAYGFRVTDRFVTSAPNDAPKWLWTLKDKVPHMHITTIPESQISLPFDFLVLQAILRRAPNDPKWPETLKGQRYPIYI